MSFPRYKVVWDTLRVVENRRVLVYAVIDYGTHRMVVDVEEPISDQSDIERAKRRIVNVVDEFVKVCSTEIPSMAIRYPFAYADRVIELAPGFQLHTGIDFSTVTGYHSWAKIRTAVEDLKQFAVRAAGLILKEIGASARISWFDGVQIEWIWDHERYGENIEVTWMFGGEVRDRGVVRIPKLEIIRRAIEETAGSVARQYRGMVQKLINELSELEKQYGEDDEDIVVQSIKRQRQSLEMLLDLDND